MINLVAILIIRCCSRLLFCRGCQWVSLVCTLIQIKFVITILPLTPHNSLNFYHRDHIFRVNEGHCGHEFFYGTLRGVKLGKRLQTYFIHSHPHSTTFITPSFPWESSNTQSCSKTGKFCRKMRFLVPICRSPVRLPKPNHICSRIYIFEYWDW